jgi:hypothetical protein
MEGTAISQTYLGDNDDLLANDALLPAQQPRRHTEPVELELYRAILRLAAEDLGHHKPAIRMAAADWFAHPHAGNPVSLAMVCEVLGLRPRHASRTALKWAGLR